MRSRRAVAAVGLCVAMATGVAVADDGPAVTGPFAAVNVTQGTDSTYEFSHGNTLPLVGAPWGMTDWSIQNHGGIAERWYYAAKNTHFVGFRMTHQPCPWAGDFGDALFAPQVGDVKLKPADWYADYDPAATVQRPDYAKVRLDKYNVTAELTATERCGVMRLTFDPGDKVGRLVVDPAGPALLQASGNRFGGYSRHHNSGVADFRCYFVAELDRPITKGVGIADTGPAKRGEKPPPQPSPGYVEFDLTGRPTVEVRIATSYISIEQAERNLTAETAGGFDAVRQRTAAAWADKLARIDVDGTDEQRATFYTCLYRAMKFPQKLYEVDAAGRPVHYSPWDGKVHDGVAYTNSGLWDTFRTQFPFLSIAYPDQLGEIVAGWLNAYREGGWLPQWPSPGGYRGMTGSHADALVADAIAKGIGGFDANTAYAALHRDAFEVPPAGPHAGGREGMANYLKLGYLPVDSAPYWVSTSLDYAYDDWCVAQAAKLTGHADDYRLLMARSMNYRKLWDSSVGFMRGRAPDGRWDAKPFDEFAWGGGYTESGPWQASWAVQHDPRGLAELAGGNAAFAAKLDKLFDQRPVYHTGGYGGVIHEMTEFVACKTGQCALNNQPSFHIPYLYAAVGQPWKTERWTRHACRTLFNAGVDGYPGDEDNGSAASWYLLSSLGVYPLTPGRPSYVLTSPVFRSATIHLAGGRAFTVSAPDNSDADVYVRSRTLNGQPWTNTWITHGQLAEGGTLVDQMGDHAAERDVKPSELPYSAQTEMKQ